MEKFWDYLKGTRGVPFFWGKNDCCTFVSGAIESIHGWNPMPESLIEAYTSEEESKQALSDAGFESVAEIVDSMFTRKAWTMADTGDIVMLSSGILSIKTPRGVWVIADTGGCEIYPSSDEVLTVWGHDSWVQQ